MTKARQFGRSPHATWEDAESVADKAARAAAQQQHELALAVREWKDRDGKTNQDLADLLGIHVETLGRYLRGEVALSLTTFNRIAYEIDQPVNVSLGSADDEEAPND